MDSGCVTIGRAVASNTKDPIIGNCNEKTKIRHKNPIPRNNCCVNASYKSRNIYYLFRQSFTDFSLFLPLSRSFHSLMLTSVYISFWHYGT